MESSYKIFLQALYFPMAQSKSYSRASSSLPLAQSLSPSQIKLDDTHVLLPHWKKSFKSHSPGANQVFRLGETGANGIISTDMKYER